MKSYSGRYAYLFFLIPFLALAIIYFSANQVIQQVLDIRRHSLAAVAKWHQVHRLTEQRFQFLEPNPGEDGDAWQQALSDFELALHALANTPHRWMLNRQTNQDMDALVEVWKFSRENILESDAVYQEMLSSPVGRVLLEKRLPGLAENALTGKTPGLFTPGDLWQYYQLQDRLSELGATNTVFTGYLERVQQAVERRVLTLNMIITGIAMLVSAMVIVTSWRLFLITSDERERYVVAIETKNRELAREVAERRLAEEHLRLTLHSIGDAVIATDANGRVERMNPVAEQLTGWALTEVQGRHLTEIFTIVNTQTRQPVENPVARVVSEGQVVGLANHTVLIRRDGSERQIADSAAPICTPDGRLMGVVMVFRDVTEAYRLQQELAASEDRYRQLFELESDAIFLIDNQSGQIIETNSAASEMYGFSRKELLQKKNTDLSAEPDETQRVTQATPIVKDNVVYIPLRYHRKQDGTVFPVEITGRFFEHNGHSVHIAAIRDISLRKTSEAELRAREAKLSSIFRAAPVGIGMVVNRIITEANDTLCVMVGYGRDELLGQSARLLYPTQEEYEYVGQAKYEQIRQRGTGTVETRWRCKDGRILYILLSSTPIDPQDWSQGVTFTALDITQRKEAEEAIRSKTIELDSFFTAALDLLCIADLEGRFRRLNPQWEQTLGYPMDELIGFRFLDLIHPDDVAATLETIQDLAQGNEVINFTNRYRHQDGSYRWIEWRSYPAGDLIYAAARDISERKQFEQELQSLNQRLKRELRFNEALLSAIPTPVFFKDASGHYLGCNQAFADVMGYRNEEIKGKTVFDIWPSELATKYQQADLYLLAHPQHQAYEGKVIGKDGQSRDVYFAKDVFYDETGEIAGIVGAYMDVTERNRALEALRTSKETERQFAERLTHLVSAITELSTAPDFDSLCRRAIEMGIAHLGFERLGLWFFAPDQPEMFGAFGVDEQGSLRDERGIRIPIRSGGLHEVLRASNRPDLLLEEDTIQDAHGQVIAHGMRIFCGLWDGHKALGTLSSDNLLNMRPFTSQDKEILRIYSIALGHLFSLKLAQTELSQLTIALEQRVQERTRQLEETNKELEAFSYSVSHDLRSPLRAVDGFSRLLMDDYAAELPGEARAYLERVRAAAQHMGQLIDDLLNLSRLSRAHMGRTQVNLSELVQGIAAGLMESQPERQVEWLIAPDLTEYVDLNLIRLVFDNLLCNAWKFTSQQSTTHIEFGSLVQDDKRVYFVRDNGAGFDMAYADKLFRAFQRLHSPGEFEGTGIGLTIVQRIIHRHGGRIWAEGAVGQGATFYFTFS